MPSAEQRSRSLCGPSPAQTRQLFRLRVREARLPDTKYFIAYVTLRAVKTLFFCVLKPRKALEVEGMTVSKPPCKDFWKVIVAGDTEDLVPVTHSQCNLQKGR